MSLYLKRLSLTNARLEILARTETDLRARFLELMMLREQFRTAAFGGSTKRGAGFRARAGCYHCRRLACAAIGCRLPMTPGRSLARV
jgi:hypothetical protein